MGVFLLVGLNNRVNLGRIERGLVVMGSLLDDRFRVLASVKRGDVEKVGGRTCGKTLAFQIFRIF